MGVVGHRPDRLRLAGREALAETLRSILATVQDERSSSVLVPELGALTPLAEGTDRLFAEQALALGLRMDCVLPFARAEFERDFQPPRAQETGSLERFRRLLARATTIVELAGSRADEGGAYAACGRAVLVQADLLVVVWDGARQGRGGGTEATFDEALRRGVLVVWIDAHAPHAWQVCAENAPSSSAPARAVPDGTGSPEALRSALRSAKSAATRFEVAADALVRGELAVLRALLGADHRLVRARSPRPHRATLLHYLAANGVEDERQCTPPNAVELARVLLEAGAEVDATAETYGGGAQQTTLNLLVSSTPPARAALQVALLETLLDFGAAPEGVVGDGSPLVTALAFGHAPAAEALARRGARVDTLIVAAALGRLERVRDFFDAAGELRTDAPLVGVGWLAVERSARAQAGLALVWAALHGRTPVVEFLLRAGIDPGARDPRRWTALHWAACNGHAETVRVLLQGRAPLEAQNEFDGTPLEQTLWTAAHERTLAGHAAVVQFLLDAGATLGEGWQSVEFAAPLAVVLRRGRPGG